MGLFFPGNKLMVAENFQKLNKPWQGFLHIRKRLIQLLGKGIDILAAIDAFPNEAAVSIQCNLAETGLMEKLLGNPAVKSGPLLFQRNDPRRILRKFCGGIAGQEYIRDNLPPVSFSRQIPP